MSSVRTPQQNGVVERRNQTLVEAARTMLIFSRAPLFLWAEAIATATAPLFTKDREDIGKLGAKGDIGFFIGYSADSCAYRIYNRRTKKIMETINVSFDELSAMAFEQRSSKHGLQCMTSGQISSGLDLTYALSTITKQQPTKGELDLLFEAMYEDYFGGQPSATLENVSPAQEPQVRQTSTASTTIADNVSIPTNSSSHETNIPITSQDVDELNLNAMVDGKLSIDLQTHPQDHPLEQVIGEPSRPVLTRNQLRSDGDMCIYALTVSTMEPKNVKEAMTDPAWIESMQEELLQFKRIDDLHTADYTQLYDFLKYNQKEHLIKINQNFLQQPITNPEDITDPTTAMNMALALMAKAFKLNYSTPTNNNQRISSTPRNRQIAQPECRESGCSEPKNSEYRRWDPVILYIAPRMWSSGLSVAFLSDDRRNLLE
nr:hypothetical protein [Tanacetum cinerariifolium]